MRGRLLRIDPAVAEALAVATAVQARLIEADLSLAYQVRVVSRVEVMITGLDSRWIVSRRRHPPVWGVVESGREVEALAGPQEVAAWLMSRVAAAVEPKVAAA